MSWFPSPPNLLTFARISITPFTLAAILGRDYEHALLLASIAGFTDAADGWLARRFHWETRLGAYLDPIADKLLLSGVFVAFGMIGDLPVWLVALVFARDLFILAGVAVVYLKTRRRDYPPSMWGKLSTAVQILAVLSLLCERSGLRWLAPVSAGLIWLTAATTAWSGIDYGIRGVRML